MAKEMGGLDLEHGGASLSRSDAAPKSTPMHFDKMVDMRRTSSDRVAENMPMIADDRNHRMTMTLGGPELEKLDRDTDIEPGTILHFCCMAEVKEVHRGTMESLVVEVIKMAVENEDEESEKSISDDDRMKNRYGDEEEEHY